MATLKYLISWPAPFLHVHIVFLDYEEISWEHYHLTHSPLYPGLKGYTVNSCIKLAGIITFYAQNYIHQVIQRDLNPDLSVNERLTG